LFIAIQKIGYFDFLAEVCFNQFTHQLTLFIPTRSVARKLISLLSFFLLKGVTLVKHKTYMPKKPHTHQLEYPRKQKITNMRCFIK